MKLHAFIFVIAIASTVVAAEDVPGASSEPAWLVAERAKYEQEQAVERRKAAENDALLKKIAARQQAQKAQEAERLAAQREVEAARAAREAPEVAKRSALIQQAVRDKQQAAKDSFMKMIELRRQKLEPLQKAERQHTGRYHVDGDGALSAEEKAVRAVNKKPAPPPAA